MIIDFQEAKAQRQIDSLMRALTCEMKLANLSHALGRIDSGGLLAVARRIKREASAVERAVEIYNQEQAA